MILPICLLVSALIGVCRSWLFHKLKFALKGESTNFRKYLSVDFGNINHLFIPYLKTDSHREIVQRINTLTTLLYGVGLLCITLFITRFF
jgi:hypothetical protein